MRQSGGAHDLARLPRRSQIRISGSGDGLLHEWRAIEHDPAWSHVRKARREFESIVQSILYRGGEEGVFTVREPRLTCLGFLGMIKLLLPVVPAAQLAYGGRDRGALRGRSSCRASARRWRTRAFFFGVAALAIRRDPRGAHARGDVVSYRPCWCRSRRVRRRPHPRIFLLRLTSALRHCRCRRGAPCSSGRADRDRRLSRRRAGAGRLRCGISDGGRL